MATLRLFMVMQRIWLLMIMMSGGIAFVVALELLPGRSGLYIGIFMVILSIIVALAYWFYSAQPKIRGVEKLTDICGGNVTYWPRKHSFLCKKDGELYCYNYATSMYYRIALQDHDPQGKKIGVLTPLDYYCFKMLGGKLISKDGVNEYTGRLETLTADPGRVVRGSGRVVYSRNPENLEKG
ncbi:MAG: hypothetical protein F7C38_01825 [Desulfurococcales archaeon]|nr:hypothetical protein [Desulfurococcales archaeon]